MSPFISHIDRENQVASLINKTCGKAILSTYLDNYFLTLKCLGCALSVSQNKKSKSIFLIHISTPYNFQRIQNLYRPRMGAGNEPLGRLPAAAPAPAPAPPDPPPKYTPPPSYSTATGARLLNTIRRSFRTLRRYVFLIQKVPSLV